jgi:hypothetical protein
MSSRQVSHQTFETFAMGSNATCFSTLRRNEPSFDIIKNKKKGGGRENTFLVILLYVFLQLTNSTPEKKVPLAPGAY